MESKLEDLVTNPSWKSFMDKNKKYLAQIESILKMEKQYYPIKEQIFNAMNSVSLTDIRIVILGQDPYPKIENGIPQAMGLSFSVPNGISIPSSLQNIFKNQIKFGHINQVPKSGDLTRWTKQGCLLLNSSLSVSEGNPGSHMKYWEKFTDELISYISDNTKNIVFMLWGMFSFGKLKFIDSDDHKVIISSHPSGLSCNKPMKQYGSFNDVDHFGLANKYLIEHDKQPINW